MRSVSLTMGAVMGLMLAVNAQADHVSTFNVSQADFVLYGFSENSIPTDGPDFIEVSNIVGTYDLDIPEAGGLWDVYVDALVHFDFDQDGVADGTAEADSVYLGQFPSPGPSTSWGPDEIPLPDLTFEYGGYELMLHDLLLGYDVDLDGEYPSDNFGPDAYGNFTLSNDTGGNLYDLNVILTMLDNAGGGGDGIMDGWVWGQVTITAVPEPATMGLLALGGLMVLRPRQRR